MMRAQKRTDYVLGFKQIPAANSPVTIENAEPFWVIGVYDQTTGNPHLAVDIDNEYNTHLFETLSTYPILDTLEMASLGQINSNSATIAPEAWINGNDMLIVIAQRMLALED